MDASILVAAVLNGLLAGGIYVLVAIGLTLIYGVLHIINFAHGSLLMIGMYGVYFLLERAKVSPYASLAIMIPGMFVFGYCLYRFVIGRFAHGKDENILLITLGIAIILDNLALYFFTGDTRTIDIPAANTMVSLVVTMVPATKVISFVASLALCGALALVILKTDLGRAIRAVAKERMGARLVGIDVDHVFAMSYAIGIACLGAAACLLLPTFYVSPTVGNAFVIVAFTIVVLGGMGSFIGALVGGLLIGIVESVGGLLLGESLGQIGISLIFILILLFRPSGLFGSMGAAR